MGDFYQIYTRNWIADLMTCEEAADHGVWVRRDFAEACEGLNPDRFDAERNGHRHAHYWQVEYTWATWVNRLFSRR